MSVPLGLQFGGSAGRITNQSVAINSSSIPVGLQVQTGKTLTLVGGDVSLNGGRLTAWGGRVELGGLTGAGTVGLNGDGSLSFPDGVARADVSLTNEARADVTAGGGGSIAVNARNLDVLGGSRLLAGISQGSGSVGSQAGDIEINATGAVTIASSTIFNIVGSEAVGNAGGINITTGSLSLTTGAQLATSTLGQGDAGSVNINARDTVSFDGVRSNKFTSGAFSTVEFEAVGNAGGINVTTGSLSLTTGAQLAADTLGQGDAGSVNINARDTVSFDGVGSNGYASAASQK